MSVHKFLPNQKTNEFYSELHHIISVLRRELVLLSLVSCLVLASIHTALCRSSVPVIYIAGDGSGDFNCHGKNDQIQINQALQFVAENSRYTTVHLKGPFTYTINDTLLIGSNTIL